MPRLVKIKSLEAAIALAIEDRDSGRIGFYSDKRFIHIDTRGREANGDYVVHLTWRTCS
jgi:hypothetical protein